MKSHFYNVGESWGLPVTMVTRWSTAHTRYWTDPRSMTHSTPFQFIVDTFLKDRTNIFISLTTFCIDFIASYFLRKYYNSNASIPCRNGWWGGGEEPLSASYPCVPLL